MCGRENTARNLNCLHQQITGIKAVGINVAIVIILTHKRTGMFFLVLNEAFNNYSGKSKIAPCKTKITNSYAEKAKTAFSFNWKVIHVIV